jgi:hypothetical protein
VFDMAAKPQQICCGVCRPSSRNAAARVEEPLQT